MSYLIETYLLYLMLSERELDGTIGGPSSTGGI